MLASINKIETAFGTNLNISSAGAMGWMQFIPSTWAAYGVDANSDGRKDPYNPVDAICAAARYLRAAGGDHDIRQAIFAYNHADWYVDEVLLGANQYGRPPTPWSARSPLTEGAHFPVAADARYADDIDDAAALARSTTQRKAAGNAADVITSDASRRSINVYSSLNAPVVAVNDGVIKKMNSKELGKFIVLQDAYGNRYTYSQLGQISEVHPVPRQRKLGAGAFELEGPNKDAAPKTPATAGDNSARRRRRRRALNRSSRRPNRSRRRAAVPATPRGAASGSSPCRGGAERRPGELSGLGICRRRPLPLAGQTVPGHLTVQFDPEDHAAEAAQGRLPPDRRLRDRADRQVPERPAAAQLRDPPAGRGAPTIDPKTDGWKLLETTAIYWPRTRTCSGRTRPSARSCSSRRQR